MVAGADAHLSRIAVVRMLPGLGDLLCAVPALQGLRAARPDANITFIGRGSSRWFAHRYSSLIDDWLGCTTGVRAFVESTNDPAALDALLDTARQRSFDLAIQMHDDGRATNAFTASLGASRWGGLSRVPTSGGSTALIDDAAHEVDRCVEAVRAAQIEITPGPGGFPVAPTDRLPVGVGDGPFAVVHAGASRPDRRWPADWFSAVAAFLAADGPCRADGQRVRALAHRTRARWSRRRSTPTGRRPRGADAARHARCAAGQGRPSSSPTTRVSDTSPPLSARRRSRSSAVRTAGVGNHAAAGRSGSASTVLAPVDDVLTAVDTVLGVPC